MLQSRQKQHRLQELEAENNRLKRAVEELSLLNELALSIGASNDTQQIIHTIVRKVVKNVHAEQGDIMLLTESSNNTLTTFIRTADSGIQQSGFRLDDSLLGWMQIYKKPLMVNRPQADERFKGAFWDPSIVNLLCAPLMIRTRLLGILTAYNKRDGTAGFTEEDLRLLSIIAAQSAHIIENARLSEEERALGRMREELRLAQNIQHSLLPEQQDLIPGYDVAGRSIPAQTVGGDYYDIFPTHDQQFALCVGDASGKGLPASLFIANVQATLQGQSLWSPSVSMCLQRVNHLLAQRTQKGFFVTLFYGVLNPRSNQFAYANAGHNRPLLRRANGRIERLDLGDVMLGFAPDFSFREDAIVLMPGDTLLMYSDGITEAKNEAGELFEEHRLLTLFEHQTASTAEALVDLVFREVNAFTGNAPQSDDITLLILKRDVV